jgi:hypothetical protein
MNLTLLDSETQNLKFRSITETVLNKSKNFFFNFLVPDAFLTKEYCRN